MFCPNCGKSNPDDSRFCESCGTNMLEAPAAPVAPPPVQTTYQQPAPTPQPVAYQPVQQAVP
jgi:predicted amidophosphoribosyltransferase